MKLCMCMGMWLNAGTRSCSGLNHWVEETEDPE